MIELTLKTKGNAPASDRQAVLFVCHPDDLEEYYSRICEMLWTYVDCSVYCPADLGARFDDKDCEELFDIKNGIDALIVPVTRSLLKTDCAAVDLFRMAQKKNVPVLPILYEPDAEGYEAKFGNTQYLDPNCRERTGIGFARKLEKRLFEVLIDNDFASKVRCAFGARMFLSYRKKDRAAADDLMRRIHSAGEPDLRGAAIWYDEDLTPGEDYEKNIYDQLKDCDLFLLTVTNALLQPDDQGRTNYVAAREYPAALLAGKPIVPVMAEEVDLLKLKSAFDGVFHSLPECLDIHDTFKIKNRLKAVLGNRVRSENDSDPERLYLIGMGYLLGVCVERNRELGRELLIKAAERKHFGAMEKLRDMFLFGDNVECDYDKARFWAEECVKALEPGHGPDREDCLQALNALADVYVKCAGKWFENARKIYEQLLFLEQGPCADVEDLLSVMHNLAFVYGQLYDPVIALDQQKKLYEYFCNYLTEENVMTQTALINLAAAYRRLGLYEKDCEEYEKAREHLEESAKCAEKAYDLLCASSGTLHSFTIAALTGFAHALEDLAQVAGKPEENDQRLLEKALRLLKRAYVCIPEKDRETTPAALTILLLEAGVFHAMKKSNKTAAKMAQDVYNKRCALIGETHPATLNALHVSAVFYMDCDDFNTAVVQFEKCCQLREQTLGKENRETLQSLGNLALAYKTLGAREKKPVQKSKYYKQAFVLMKKCCALYEKVFGLNDPETKRARENLKMAKRLYELYSVG